MRRLLLAAAAVAALATPHAHAETAKPIDITVAFECREVRTWEGYGDRAGNLEDAVFSHEKYIEFREKAIGRAQTNADIEKAWKEYEAYENEVKVFNYEPRILVAYNHGVADTATVADAFWRTRIVEATPNSITIARDFDEDNEWLGSVDGTIDRRSGHGQIYYRKTNHNVQEDGTYKTEHSVTQYVVECAAAQPAKF